jgi:hypothetical protein
MNSVAAFHKAGKEIPVAVLTMTIDRVQELLRKFGVETTQKMLPTQAVFHERKQYTLSEVLDGFVSGKNDFIGNSAPIACVPKAFSFEDEVLSSPMPTTAPMKKLGKPLTEVFEEEERERERARRINEKRLVQEEAIRVSRLKARQKAREEGINPFDACLEEENNKEILVGPQSSLQSEAECLDNKGMEDSFDLNITYIVEPHVDRTMLWVTDKFGARREYYRTRFTKVSL